MFDEEIEMWEGPTFQVASLYQYISLHFGAFRMAKSRFHAFRLWLTWLLLITHSLSSPLNATPGEGNRPLSAKVKLLSFRNTWSNIDSNFSYS